ncbi:Flp pilus assembly protein CpaB [Bradyrhizobium sp. STM 3557]|uniref:Flp pilus assembly protein CpaB n=1 Tax=Bradyrhizobium sp. STM 3557 TaxID=578920 RepID=UPI00388F18BB
MMTARIVVLAIALSAGGVAAYLVSNTDKQQQAPTAPVVQLPTAEVLVAKVDIGLGQAIKPGDLSWQAWPEAASNVFIRRSDRPDATNQLVGSIARFPFLTGEPIREQKLVKADGSGFMAAILPTGMRAVSTEISPETGAGGFILPNDRVDVLLTRRQKNPDHPDQSDISISEIILANIRVLAIDQAPKEKDGQTTVVGKTVTLELRPEQTATLTAARSAGSLSLALRSIADVNVAENRIDETSRPRGIAVVRYGISSTITTQK